MNMTSSGLQCSVQCGRSEEVECAVHKKQMKPRIQAVVGPLIVLSVKEL